MAAQSEKSIPTGDVAAEPSITTGDIVAEPSVGDHDLTYFRRSSNENPQLPQEGIAEQPDTASLPDNNSAKLSVGASLISVSSFLRYLT